MSQNGVPMVNSQAYANDPSYRAAWDQTLDWEKKNRPGWKGQETYWARANDADWTRLQEEMARNLSTNRAANPQPAAGTPGAPGTPNMNAFFTSPGYQFRRDEGTRGIEGTFAARGGAQSGNALRALSEFNSNLASSEFGNYFNQLSSLAGIGQTATNQTAAYGADAANQAGRNALISGDARASGIAGQANAIGGTVNNLAGLYGYYKRPGGGSGGPWSNQAMLAGGG